MLLTDKAKKDFLAWLYSEYYYQDLSILYPSYLEYSIVIEWFDSVEIYLTIGRYGYILNTEDIRITRKTGDARPEATKQAIIKANELYNNRNNNQD